MTTIRTTPTPTPTPTTVASSPLPFRATSLPVKTNPSSSPGQHVLTQLRERQSSLSGPSNMGPPMTPTLKQSKPPTTTTTPASNPTPVPPPTTTTTSTQQPTSYYKNHLDIVTETNRTLTARLEQIERENRDLKKSVYELSYLYSMSLHRLSQLSSGKRERDRMQEMPPPPVFDLTAALASHDKITTTTETTTSIPTTPTPNVTIPSTNDTSNITKLPHHDHYRVPHTSTSLTQHRLLHRKHDLTGHSGAVYTVQFSPHGKLLASGSLDKSVRVWDLETGKREVLCLSEHTLNISDLVWSNDSQHLYSGSFDRTVKLWDVITGKMLMSWDTTGFVQSVQLDPDNNLVCVATTGKNIVVYDKRQPTTTKPAFLLENDSIVSSIHVYNGTGTTITGTTTATGAGLHILSGDYHGQIKTWNLATGKCISQQSNDPQHRPISHMTVSRPAPRHHYPHDEQPSVDRFLAVNSFDNVLRVYAEHQTSYPRRNVVEQSYLPLVHELRSHKNKNWPIKSSFYHGRDYDGEKAWRQAAVSSSNSSNNHSDSSTHPSTSRPEDDDHDTTPHPSHDTGRHGDWFVDDTILLASGSADHYAYIFDVGGPSGSGRLLQRLEGHKDRVYAVHFHPHQPVLATCSADMTVKIWMPKPS